MIVWVGELIALWYYYSQPVRRERLGQVVPMCARRNACAITSTVHVLKGNVCTAGLVMTVKSVSTYIVQLVYISWNLETAEYEDSTCLLILACEIGFRTIIWWMKVHLSCRMSGQWKNANLWPAGKLWYPILSRKYHVRCGSNDHKRVSQNITLGMTTADTLVTECL